MPILTFPLPTVESGQKYAPGSLAQEIQNLRLTPDGVLESVRGPTVLIPNYGSGYPYGGGRMYGVFHALLDNGTRDVTLIRAGTNLYQQTGWTRSVAAIQTGLSADPNARFPDQFCEVAGKIVWNNGIDTPVIFDGYMVLPLGYDQVPGAPSALGPGDSGHPVFRNQEGYSHPGRIGTVSNFYSADQGTLVPYARQYFVQFEDAFGNRSPLSPASQAVVLRQEPTQNQTWNTYDDYPSGTTSDLGLLSVNTDDLTKQFVVDGIPLGPVGTVARIVYATVNTNYGPAEPRLLVRIPDNTTTLVPDNTPDGALGPVAEDYIVLPRFQAMCAHEGRLYVLEGRNVRRSEPGFPGTLRREEYVPLDADGAEPTGVFSFGGKVYAATTNSLYMIDTGDALRCQRITTGIGLVGPNAIDSTEFGVALGLGVNGFWTLDQGGSVQPVSREEYPLFKRLNRAMLGHSCIRWSPRDREALCAIPTAGGYGNNLMMTWDGTGWKRRVYGLSLESLCVTKDWRQYVLAAGETNVYVLSCETQTYTPPEKTYRYRSQWLRMDPMGLRRFNVDKIFIGIVETTRNDLTCTVWQNGTRDTAVVTSTFQACNPATTEVLNTLVLGTGKLRTPRLTWKEVSVRVRSAESFSFDLSCLSTTPTFLSIAAFAFDGTVTDDSAATRSRQ